MTFFCIKNIFLDFFRHTEYNTVKEVLHLNKNMYVKKHDKNDFLEKEGLLYEKELKKSAEKAINSTSALTFYFADRDTNPLKNVLTSVIQADMFTEYHKHDFFEMNYVVSGVLHENIGGKSFSLTGGDLLFMAPGVYHACCPETDAKCFNILFKTDWLKRVAEDFEKYDSNNYLSALASNKIYSIISTGTSETSLNNATLQIHEMTRHLVHHVDLYENLIIENHAYEYLLSLTKFTRQEYSFVSGKLEHRESFNPDDIVRYINDNFNKITLSDVTARFGYSASQLHRILKTNTDYSFTELILNMRMQRARHYLLNTHLPIKNIAYLLGLDSAEHFSRMFKKNRGMTPKEYREQFMRVSLKKAK